MDELDFIVIGGGLAGVYASFGLAQEASNQVLLLEKSKGVGGRLATRRVPIAANELQLAMDNSNANTIKPELTVVQKALVQVPLGCVQVNQPVVSELLKNRVFPDLPLLKPWENGLVFHGIGTEFLKQLMAKGQDKGLVFKSQTRLLSLNFSQEEKKWTAICEQLGETKIYIARSIVLAIPAPQAYDLLMASRGCGDFPFAVLQNQKMACRWTWVLVIQSDQKLKAVYPVLDHDSIETIINLQDKPGFPQVPGVHALQISMTLAWSEQHQNADKLKIQTDYAQILLTTIQDLLGFTSSLNVVSLQAHKWLYAHPLNPLSAGFLVNDRRDLWVTGDWAAGIGVDDSARAVELMLKAMD